MKKNLSILTMGIMFFSVGTVYACTGIGCGNTTVQVPSIETSSTGAKAINTQFENQGLTPLSQSLLGGNSNLFQHQTGNGLTKALVGSSAFESQNQGQNILDSIVTPVATHNFDSTTYTSGLSSVPKGKGNAFHAENQDVNMNINTTSNNAGTNSLAGSNMLVDQCVVVGAKNGLAGAGAANDSHSSYDLVNNGPNSTISQVGNQNSSFISGATVGKNLDATTGAAGANLEAVQAGQTIAINNGAGTEMFGKGLATESIVANIGHTAKGSAGVIGGQNQTHSYEQNAGVGTNQSQWATGKVQTVGNVDVGTILVGYGS